MKKNQIIMFSALVLLFSASLQSRPHFRDLKDFCLLIYKHVIKGPVKQPLELPTYSLQGTLKADGVAVRQFIETIIAHSGKLIEKTGTQRIPLCLLASQLQKRPLLCFGALTIPLLLYVLYKSRNNQELRVLLASLGGSIALVYSIAKFGHYMQYRHNYKQILAYNASLRK